MESPQAVAAKLAVVAAVVKPVEAAARVAAAADPTAKTRTLPALLGPTEASAAGIVAT